MAAISFHCCTALISFGCFYFVFFFALFDQRTDWKWFDEPRGFTDRSNARKRTKERKKKRMKEKERKKRRPIKRKKMK